MARRSSPLSLIGSIRHIRPGLYRTARALGDLQAVASGNPRTILRRGARRVAGHAYANMQGGSAGPWRVLLDIALMLLGRGIGGRGRW